MQIQQSQDQQEKMRKNTEAALAIAGLFCGLFLLTIGFLVPQILLILVGLALSVLSIPTVTAVVMERAGWDR